MKALAYNHLGEIVFSDAAGARFCGKSAKRVEPESALDPARFLRCSADAPESIWLCALAACLQPPGRAMEAGRFFKLCVAGQSEARAKEALKPFARCVLAAFLRLRAPDLDFSNGEEGFRQAQALHLALGLRKPASAIAPWAEALFEPRALSCLRLAAQELGLSAVELPFGEADPFDGTASPGRLAASPATPWPLLPFSGLREPDGPFDPALLARLSVTDAGVCLQLPDAQSDMAQWDWGLDGLWAGFSPPRSEAELSARWRSAPKPALASGRLAYDPLTRLKPAESATPAPLWLSQRKLFSAIKSKGDDWDAFVSAGLGIEQAELPQIMSAEQIDACGLALRAFEKRDGFIVADETGLGKGRILAAMARAFLQSGRKVLFVTERKTLFTDFWRDLTAVKADPLVGEPFLLHAQGRVYSQTGDLLFKTRGPKLYKEALAAGPGEARLVMTCYSQFNRDLKGNDRWSFAQSFAKGALLILDEAHNAAGQSQTRKNIHSLIESSARCLFSSATFAKHEDALELYLKAMPFGKRELGLLLGAMPADKGHALARAMAQGLSETGALIRREHAPGEGLQTRIVELPPNFAEQAAEQRNAMAGALDALFNLSQAIEWAKSARGMDYEPVWLKLGGALSRLCRQQNLLCKIEYASEFVAGLAEAGQKPVLALESTFESFLRALGQDSLDPLALERDEPEGEDEEERAGPKDFDQSKVSFRALFSMALQSLAPAPLLASLPDPQVKERLAFAEMAIRGLPDLAASPIDTLTAALRARGLRVGEISGRSIRLESLPDGRARLAPVALPEREAVIRDFNAGRLDALILTRAGATGISLHASADFEDQRPRAFVELEISPNASQRMQFLGRVRRKGQVVAPSYHTLSSGAPFERRLLERARAKMAKLSGLTAASSELSAGSLDFDQTLLSPTGDRLAIEWLASRPECAKRLGLDLWKLISPEAQEGPSERLLKRLPLLPSTLQDEAYDFLIAGAGADAERQARQSDGFSQARGAVLARKRKIWGLQDAPAAGADPFSPALWVEEWVAPARGGAFGSEAARVGLEEAKARFESSFAQGLGAALRRAASTRANLISHPLSQGSWRNLQHASAHLSPGARVKFSDPASSRPMEGMLLDAIPPKDEWLLYPSQWRLRILVPGEGEPFALTLGAFFADPNAYIDDAPPPALSVWEKAPERPLSFLSVSGHCVYLRWWAARCGFGAFHPFVDGFGQTREQLILPHKSTSCAVAGDWAIPLLDLRLVIALMQRDSRLAVSSSFSLEAEPPVLIRRSEGGWTLSFEQTAHDQLVDFNLERRLGPRKYERGAAVTRVSRFVSPKDIHAALGALQQAGVGFFAPSSRQGWHASALEDLLLRAPTVAKRGARSAR